MPADGRLNLIRCLKVNVELMPLLSLMKNTSAA